MADNNLKQISNLLDEKLAASEKRVIGEVGKFIEDHLFPLIEEKADKSDIDRIERKLDRVIDTGLDHGNRIKTIKQLPSIAHQLKK